MKNRQQNTRNARADSSPRTIIPYRKRDLVLEAALERYEKTLRLLGKSRANAKQSRAELAKAVSSSIAETTSREKEVKAAILKDPEASHAFGLFIKRGFNERALLTLLCIEAWGPGVLLDKTYNRYSLRRTEAAEMVDRLLRVRRRLGKETRRLPHPVISRCARDLLLTANELRRLPLWKLPPRQKTQTQSTLIFLNEVKLRTRYYSLNHIAALLRVTHQLANRGGCVSRESLRSLLQTHRSG